MRQNSASHFPFVHNYFSAYLLIPMDVLLLPLLLLLLLVLTGSDTAPLASAKAQNGLHGLHDDKLATTSPKLQNLEQFLFQDGHQDWPVGGLGVDPLSGPPTDT